MINFHKRRSRNENLSRVGNADVCVGPRLGTTNVSLVSLLYICFRSSTFRGKTWESDAVRKSKQPSLVHLASITNGFSVIIRMNERNPADSQLGVPQGMSLAYRRVTLRRPMQRGIDISIDGV